LNDPIALAGSWHCRISGLKPAISVTLFQQHRLHAKAPKLCQFGRLFVDFVPRFRCTVRMHTYKRLMKLLTLLRGMSDQMLSTATQLYEQEAVQMNKYEKSHLKRLAIGE